MEDKRVYRKPGRSRSPRQGAVLAMFGLFIVGFSLQRDRSQACDLRA